MTYQAVLNVKSIEINEIKLNQIIKMIHLTLKKEFNIVTLGQIFFIFIKMFAKQQGIRREINARNAINNWDVWNVMIFKFSKK